MKLSRPVLCLALLAVFFAVPAWAKPNSSRQAREKAAKKACIKGDVREGSDILGDLYVETNDPTYLYNQARCFEQNQRWQDSAARFREYLRKAPNLSPAERTEVEQHIAECDRHVPEAAAVAPPAVAPAPVPTSTMTAQPVALPAQAVAVAAAPVESAPSDGRQGSGLRLAGIITGAVGVGAVVTGVILAVKTQSLADDMAKPYQYSQSKADQRASYETWGWVSYGVGGAALVTGATLYVLGWRAGRATDERTVSVVPAFGAHQTSLVLTGAF